MNLASRLEAVADPGAILIDQNTHSLVEAHVRCETIDQITPKGFVRPIDVYKVDDFFAKDHQELRRKLSRVGKHVEVNVTDSSDIRAAIEELRRIQEDFTEQYSE